MFAPSTVMLIVDDMEVVRQVVKMELQALGFKRFLEAADGDVAWDLIRSSFGTDMMVGCAIVDWNMPAMSGLKLLEKIRNEPKFKNLPFVMITSEAEMEAVMEAIRKGVSSYILKPIEPGVLAAKLKEAWKKHTTG